MILTTMRNRKIACATALVLTGMTIGAAAAEPCGTSAPAKQTALPPVFRFAAVGDLIYQFPSIKIVEKNAPLIVDQLRAADVSFGNFESNSFDQRGFTGSQRASGANGPILLAPPQTLAELRSLGFNLLSRANNHAGDWGPQGVGATDQTLCSAGLIHAGTGNDLAAARAPAYLEIKGASVALVAATSTFPEGADAQDERPGADGLHLSGTGPGYTMNEADRRALLSSVETAAKNAGLVFFSLHTHEPGPSDGVPTDFEISLAHEAIDAGASAFLGHGPHELRGIEIYKGRPIFYSLANFSVSQPPPKFNPEPLVLPPGSIFTRRAFFRSVLAAGRYDNGHLSEIKLYPFELANSNRAETHGLPEAVSKDEALAILKRMQELSQPFGTKIEIDNGVGIIHLLADKGVQK